MKFPAIQQFLITQIYCLFFAISIFLCLGFSHLLPNSFPRYDFMLLACLLLQAGMVFFKLETPKELLVICLFHALGLGMELFKVNHGSWAYPEFAYTKVGGVPLYSGFMYASVASYLCQIWRRFGLHLTNLPPSWQSLLLASFIYLNFFSHHFFSDLRWFLTLTMFWIYKRTQATLQFQESTFRLPLPYLFLMLGFMVWLGENVATLFGAWQYPHQSASWRMVDLSKFSSWFLLIIVSFIVVAALHIPLQTQLKRYSNQK